jgi:hypothetical protein
MEVDSEVQDENELKNSDENLLGETVTDEEEGSDANRFQRINQYHYLASKQHYSLVR